METQPTTGATSIEENINLVKQTYDCFFRGDMEGLISHYTDDVDWEIYGPTSSVPTAGHYKGKEALMGFFGKVNDLLESDKFEIQEYVAQGNTVVAIGEYTWTSRVTGKIFDAHFTHAVTVNDGKISRFREYTDTAAAAEAMNQ